MTKAITDIQSQAGLPRNQTAHSSNASAGLALCYLDRYYMAQLTFNTDGIINKLVTVFAGGSYHLDS